MICMSLVLQRGQYNIQRHYGRKKERKKEKAREGESERMNERKSTTSRWGNAEKSHGEGQKDREIAIERARERDRAVCIMVGSD